MSGFRRFIDHVDHFPVKNTFKEGKVKKNSLENLGAIACQKNLIWQAGGKVAGVGYGSRDPGIVFGVGLGDSRRWPRLHLTTPKIARKILIASRR